MIGTESVYIFAAFFGVCLGSAMVAGFVSGLNLR